MSAEDLEKYETEMELTLYKEYRDIVSQFSYVVETERRFYLANSVDVAARNADPGTHTARLPLRPGWRTVGQQRIDLRRQLVPHSQPVVRAEEIAAREEHHRREPEALGDLDHSHLEVEALA